MENDGDLYSNDHRQAKMMEKAHKEIKMDLQDNLLHDGILDASARFRATPTHPNAFTWMYSAINQLPQLKLNEPTFIDAMRLFLQFSIVQPDIVDESVPVQIQLVFRWIM